MATARSALALAFAAGCGPSGGSPIDATESAASTDTGDASTGPGPSDGASASGSDSGTSAAASSSEGDVTSAAGSGSSDTGPTFEGCLPRAFEEALGWEAFVDGEPYMLNEGEGACTFVGLVEPPSQPGATELELSCELSPGVESSVVLFLGFPLEVVPFAIDEPLELTAISEPDGAINQQLLLSLRDADGVLRLGTFFGYAPEGKTAESHGFYAPLEIAVVDGLCPPPCDDDFGCSERAALDIGPAGREPIRIFDGNAATIPATPEYLARVIRATVGSGGIDDFGAHITLVIARTR